MNSGRKPARRCTWLVGLLAGIVLQTAHGAQADADQASLGNVMRTFIEHDVVFLRHDGITGRLQAIAGRLTQAAGKAADSYPVRVVNDALPNTYSDAGGTIYVTSGLLAQVQSEAELAHLLAHEIAHLEAGDSQARFSDVYDRHHAKVVGSSVLMGVMVLATAGLAAGAMGPMGAATTQSTTIIQVGTQASVHTFYAGISSDLGARNRMKFARADLAADVLNHPVYGPALVATMNSCVYEGYGEAPESAAGERARQLVAAAGYDSTAADALHARLAALYGDAVQPHLAAYTAGRGR
jgi:hypothetical protein